MIEKLLHNFELLVALYIIAAPICTYQTWRRTMHSTKQRRLFFRALSVGLLFTPGVFGIGHGIGIGPAWVGMSQGLYFFSKEFGRQLFFVNSVTQTFGFLLSLKIAKSFEHDGKKRDKYKFSA